MSTTTEANILSMEANQTLSINHPGLLPIPSTDELGFPCFQSYYVFETKPYFFFAAGDANGENVVILVVNRIVSQQLRMKYDDYGHVYRNMQEAKIRIQSICISLSTKIDKIYSIAAILGVLPLPKLYFVFATKARHIATIMGRPVYQVVDTAVVAVCHGSYERSRPPFNDRYRDLLRNLDLSRDYYFSYHYDLTNSLQNNLGNRNIVRKATIVSPTNESNSNMDTEADAAIETIPNTSIPLKAPTPTAPTHQYNDQFTWNSHMSKVFINKFPKALDANIDDVSTQSKQKQQQAKTQQSHPTTTTTTTTAAVVDGDSSKSSSLFPHKFRSVPTPTIPHISIAPTGPYAATRWIPALICGFVSQTRFSVGEDLLTWTLISRRDRGYAGTRYLRRGMSGRGSVANEVETEMILHQIQQVKETEETPCNPGMAGWKGQIASCLLIRGSIPLFWKHEDSYSPSPPIIIDTETDPCLGVTEVHFRNLLNRFGGRIHCVSLIKQMERKPHEMKLGYAYLNAVRAVNRRLTAEISIPECGSLLTNSIYGAVSDSSRSQGDIHVMGSNNVIKVGNGDASKCNVFSDDDQKRFEGDYKAYTDALHADDDDNEDEVTLQTNPLYDGPLNTSQKHSLFSHTAPSMHSYMGSAVAYHVYDFLARRSDHNVIAELKPLCSGLAKEVGVFSAVIGYKATQSVKIEDEGIDVLSSNVVCTSKQQGAVRVNCIDCLDRTNVTMFCIAKESMLLMMRSLGEQIVNSTEYNNNAKDSTNVNNVEELGLVVTPKQPTFQSWALNLTRLPPALLFILQKTFSEHGDRIATQYAGSGAMHKETILIDEDHGHANSNTNINTNTNTSGSGSGSGKSPLMSPETGCDAEASLFDEETDGPSSVSPIVEESTLNIKVVSTTCRPLSHALHQQQQQLLQQKRRLATAQAQTRTNNNSNKNNTSTTITVEDGLKTPPSSFLSPSADEPPILDDFSSESLGIQNTLAEFDNTTTITSTVTTPTSTSTNNTSTNTNTSNSGSGSGSGSSSNMASPVSSPPVSPQIKPEATQPEPAKKSFFSGFSLKKTFAKITGGSKDEPEETSSSSSSSNSSSNSAVSKMSGIAVNAFTAIKRYYNNNVTDIEKQQAISLLLGDYMPLTEAQRPHLWDLDARYHSMDADEMWVTSATTYVSPFNSSDITPMLPMVSKLLHGLHHPANYVEHQPSQAVSVTQSPAATPNATPFEPEHLQSEPPQLQLTTTTTTTTTTMSQSQQDDAFSLLNEQDFDNTTVEQQGNDVKKVEVTENKQEDFLSSFFNSQ